MSSSYAATTSMNNRTMPPCEIVEDQSKDTAKKEVKRTLTRIRTSVGDLEEYHLIGRDKEIFDIIDLISNKDIRFGQVISVWGMGGLGKTTLVNGVYQSPKISDKFERRAFVTIMRPFNAADLLRSLVVQLQEESTTKEELLKNSASKIGSLATMGVEALTNQLKRLLEIKRCLIVLDDLSSIAEWDDIIQGFCWIGKTTRIIVTTRKENIAHHCSGNDETVHSLEVLKEEDALNLFSQKVI